MRKWEGRFRKWVLALEKGRRTQAQFREGLKVSLVAGLREVVKVLRTIELQGIWLFVGGEGGGFRVYNQLLYSCILGLVPLRETRINALNTGNWFWDLKTFDHWDDPVWEKNPKNERFLIIIIIVVVITSSIDYFSWFFFPCHFFISAIKTLTLPKHNPLPQYFSYTYYFAALMETECLVKRS